MCLIAVWVCPDCEKSRVRKGWPILHCNNPLCRRLARDAPLDQRFFEEPCSPSCLSEHCGLVEEIRFCLDDCLSVVSPQPPPPGPPRGPRRRPGVPDPADGDLSAPPPSKKLRLD